MRRLARARRALVVGIVAAAATLSMTQVANAQPTAPDVPPVIQVPERNTAFLVGHAKGFQIYTCNGATSTWGPGSTPDAKLFDDNGELIVKHFGGPTGPHWQAKDGSEVIGARKAGINMDPTAIDWLLLSATRVPGSPDGLIANTTYIQRVATTGGRAPTTGCEQKTNGKQKKVPYTADYYFWKATSA